MCEILLWKYSQVVRCCFGIKVLSSGRSTFVVETVGYKCREYLIKFHGLINKLLK